MTVLDLFAVLRQQGLDPHEVVIERLTGRGAYEVNEYADPVVTDSFVSDGLKVMASAAGEQIISTARVALPKGTAYVPVESRVTLPPEFGSRVCRVAVVTVGDGGGLPTPDHIELGLV